MDAELIVEDGCSSAEEESCREELFPSVFGSHTGFLSDQVSCQIHKSSS